MEESGSKQGLDEIEKMGVEVLFNLFVKAFEVGQSQDENLLGMLLCPVIYEPEKSLITVAEEEIAIHLSSHIFTNAPFSIMKVPFACTVKTTSALADYLNIVLLINL